MRVWVGKLPLNYIWGLYTLIILLLLRNYCSSSWLPSSWSRSSASSSKFIRIRSNRFYVDGSSNFLFTGFNSFWLMNVAADPTRKHKVSEVFREAATAGLTVCRTWAFSDGGPAALQISPGVYDQHMFQALDFVISEADKYKIRLILSLSNNYKDFGGRPQYANWAREAGFAVSSDDDFYTDEIIKGYYKSHVRTVLTRINTVTGFAYKDDPTIMAWELINEPRCQDDSSGRTVNEWVKEMASFVKSIDRKHLLEIGLEGFYGDSVPERKQYNPNWETSGTDFIRDNLIKEIDFATIHAYPDIWLPGRDEESTWHSWRGG
ncbi:Mannan endo-1,4-beta-mannosidase [Bertholletia excelsa]